MIKRRIWVIICICFILLSMIGVKSLPLAGTSQQGAELLLGDIFFVDIYEGWCIYGYWDHLAIYVGEQTFAGGYRAPAMVEATYNGGVVLTSVENFLRRDEPAKIEVKRLGEMPERGRIIAEAVNYALAQQGKPFPGILNAWHKFGSKRLQCSEVVWRAYKSAGVELDSNRDVLLLPDDIYYSPLLELV